MQVLKPQPGPQTEFLSTPADIAIYGGAAGGGKSFALLLEPLRHVSNGQFGGVIFRRDRQQVTNEGGLWDESSEMYHPQGAMPNGTSLAWTFPSGASIGFAGLQRRDDVYKWQGSQIAFLGFDELTHFDEFQFWYMLGRNRSTSGVKPYVRAGCNPDADSWVANFVDWWIGSDGFPIAERAGALRYLVRDNDRNHWFDSRAEAVAAFPHLVEQFAANGLDPESFCKSVTFIPADVFDNKVLLERNPGYLANLLAQPLIERERLLRGNWKVRASAGKVFNREWFGIPVESVPKGGIYVRFWDLAATEKQVRTTSKKNDPDYTATVKIHYDPKLELWTIVDAFQIQANPASVETLVFQTAKIDKAHARLQRARYKLRWEIEPGSAAKRENLRWIKAFKVIGDAKGVLTGGQDKITRARGHAVQAESGNVRILRGDWNEMFLSHMHGFPDLAHDDLFDAANGAFNETIGRGGVAWN